MSSNSGSDDNELVVTVSEIQQFLRCRRMWDIVAHRRRSLKKFGPPAVALHLGSMVHKGLEAFAQGGGEECWKDAIAAKCDEELKKAQKQYATVVGVGMSGQEIAQFTDVQIRATELVRRYLIYYKNKIEPKGFKILPKGIELTFKIPVKVAEGTIFVAGTVDLLLMHEETSKLWIMDHKTFKQRRGSSDINFQFNTYMWAMERLLGPGTVGGFIYDGISTKDPTIPRVLKNGTMSLQKIDTTEHIYLTALRKANIDHEDSRYTEFLKFLRTRDNQEEGLFYIRKTIYANRAGLKSQEEYLLGIARDMIDPKIYPNFRWEGCWDCSAQDLCAAAHHREDVDYVIKNFYYKSDAPYGTIERLKATPKTITCVEDLL